MAVLLAEQLPLEKEKVVTKNKFWFSGNLKKNRTKQLFPKNSLQIETIAL